MKRQLDFGIVNFNGGQALTKCVQTILELNNIEPRVFIVDNASSDNSIEHTKNRFPDCTIIQLEKNIGYAGACNVLIPLLTTEIVVLCNMDLEFDTDWGNQLLACFDSNNYAASVSTSVYDRETKKLYSGGVFFYKDLFPLSSETLQSEDQPYDVFGSYGAVMTFRNEVFKKIGLFDNDYFLFFEETEFYLRMNINNLKTIFCPAAKVYHYRSMSTVRYSPLKLFYSERNRICTAFKYFPLWYFPVTFVFSAHRFLTMAKSGIPGSDGQGKKVHKLTILSTIFKAWIAAFMRFPGEYQKRKKLWSATNFKPVETLNIIRKYPLLTSDLKVK